MNIEKAKKIIKGEEKVQEHGGYYVCFDIPKDKFLKSDHFPNVYNGEKPYKTVDEAYRAAVQFAAKTYGECVNIHVAEFGNVWNKKFHDNFDKFRITNRVLNHWVEE